MLTFAVNPHTGCITSLALSDVAEQLFVGWNAELLHDTLRRAFGAAAMGADRHVTIEPPLPRVHLS